MLNPSGFRDLVSGRKTGVLPALLRAVLRLVEWPYSWAMRWRNFRYDRGRTEIVSVEVPVISVGNLTLGGTGKTPLVEWLARQLGEGNRRVAIVSRGYGAERGKQNDEARELALALPNVPHVQNPDRVAGTQTAVAERGAQLIVLDDGFQHRRLARDLDIVLLDATEPWGHGHVFPRGTLREPLAGLARAQVIILTRANMLDPAARRMIQNRVAQLAPTAAWCEVQHGPDELINAVGEKLPISALAGQRLAAFCGIGNPTGFRHTLESSAGDIAAWREFPDHYAYTPKDVRSLSKLAQGVDLAICTRKDLVKLGTTSLGDIPLWALSIRLQFLEGEEVFKAVIDKLQLGSPSPPAQ